jgi:hypothetical protein
MRARGRRLPRKKSRLISGHLSSPAMRRPQVINSVVHLGLCLFTVSTAVLTWSIIELCRYPSLQERLRTELLAGFPGSEDPTHDDLTNNLPLLDAFVHEVLRLHPGVPETFRTVILFPRPLSCLSHSTCRPSWMMYYRSPNLSSCRTDPRRTASLSGRVQRSPFPSAPLTDRRRSGVQTHMSSAPSGGSHPFLLVHSTYPDTGTC